MRRTLSIGSLLLAPLFAPSVAAAVAPAPTQSSRPTTVTAVCGTPRRLHIEAKTTLSDTTDVSSGRIDGELLVDHQAATSFNGTAFSFGPANALWFMINNERVPATAFRLVWTVRFHDQVVDRGVSSFAPLECPPIVAIVSSDNAYALVDGHQGVAGFGSWTPWVPDRLPQFGTFDNVVGAASVGSWPYVADAFGHVHGPEDHGHLTNLPARPIVAIAATANGRGYWLTSSNGAVYAFGNAPYRGGLTSLTLKKPIVAIGSTATNNGYWLFASDGGVFTLGDAHYYGSTGALRLKQPIVAAAATPNGKGYWLVASDGGVFTFGNATFHGSTGARNIDSPIVGMAHSTSGNGYWLASANGRVYQFGDAPYRGQAF